MKKILCLTVLCALLSGVFPVFVQSEENPVIQIAILLDTSNSMDGLINQAKTQLWKIVNEFATTKKNGQIPELQVALYEYGKSSLSPQVGYIRLILPLTSDLDKVSEELFALRTNGGDEYCGWVIRNASKELRWSQSNNDFKAIFIAGNEPFTQGPVDFRKSCQAAIANGIIVNTIHCGPYEEGVRTMWREGALLADGSYMNIDQNRQVVQVQTPQDKEIMELNGRLNKTYIPYGVKGKVSQERQKEQDSNAGGMASEVMVQRTLAKTSAQYRNAAWDLVDAINQKQVKLEDLKTEDLPEEMQKMTMEERKAYLEAQEKLRTEVRAKIQKLNAERERYIAEERKKLQASGDDTLDAAMIKVLRRQLEKKNYETK